MKEDFFEQGWVTVPAEADVLDWVRAALPVARARVADPDMQHWLRHGGTWFVGVDALPNDARGAVGDTGPLRGAAFDLACALYGDLPLHPGQVSVTYPGYPRADDSESEAAFRFRLKRDAAHVDGLLPTGPERQRHLMERHAYILGLPLTACGAGASPLTVWPGSHRIMRAVFEEAFGDVPHEDWDSVDVTEIYKQARRTVFDTCERVEVPAQPGQAYVLHRHLLHGVAPWSDGASAPDDGRMIVYFRPEWPEAGDQWLTAP